MTQDQSPIIRPWWSKMVIYWLDNQVALSFYSDLPPSAGKQAIINSLNLEDFNQFLTMRGYDLRSFTEKHVPRRRQAHPHHATNEHTDHDHHDSEPQEDEGKNLKSLLGKHIFQHPSGHGSIVLCFFNIVQTAPYASSGISVMDGHMYHGSHSSSAGYGTDPARTVINLLNTSRKGLLRDSRMPVLNAAPNWLCGGTPVVGGCTTHGCPMTPPIPVDNSPATWHMTLPELSSTLQQRAGEGVTVFVLDTSPSLEQIKAAAQLAGDNNTLLKTIVEQIEASEPSFTLRNHEYMLPTVLEQGDPMQPATGRDILGRLMGFEMSDHGLFVAGLIRDIAPAANIECIRVLNDYGVGTTSVLIQALEDIHNRMLPLNPDTDLAGDLYNQPVVVNLSLIAGPHQEEIANLWGSTNPADSDTLLVGLRAVIQSLTTLGAVVVGSVGNDSDTRQAIPATNPTTMQITTQRMLPRYPAAFPEVLAVGAVDNTGHASPFSNYPVNPGAAQNNGIATYGGNVPQPIFPQSPSTQHPHHDHSTHQSLTHNHTPHPPIVHPHPHEENPCPPFDPEHMVSVDKTKLDALIGLHTACCYPALSADDKPDEYAAPNNSAWAYWSGTSFATPIISALAARLLEELHANTPLQPYQWHREVLNAFTTTNGQQTYLTTATPLARVHEFSEGGVNIGLIKAQQIGITPLPEPEPEGALSSSYDN